MRGVSFLAVFEEHYDLLLQLFLLLSPADIFRLRRVSSGIRRTSEEEITWKILYYHLCTRGISSQKRSNEVAEKMKRPWNEETIGWRVEVSGREGVILDFRVNPEKLIYKEEYLIRFDDSEETIAEWMAENDGEHEFLTCSNSPFRFLSAPRKKSQEDIGENEASMKSIVPSHLEYSPSASEQRNMYDFFKHQQLNPSSWKQAYLSLVFSLPDKPLTNIQVHEDEVLDVAFSHSGDLLAAVSRDGSFSLTRFSSLDSDECFGFLRCQPVAATTHRGLHTKHGCSVAFSPCDTFFSVVSCDPYDPIGGAIAEIFSIDYSPDSINKLESICVVSMAYNMHVPWIDDNHFLVTDRLVVDDRMHEQSLRILDVQTRDVKTLIIRVYGTIQLPTLLHVKPGSEVKVNGSDLSAEGDCLVCSHCSPNVEYSYCQILSVTPLSKFDHNAEAIDYREYPFIDVRGAIVGIAVNSNVEYPDVIVVNVRPHIEGAIVHSEVSPDISHDAEIRVYCSKTLQHIYSYTGHHGFTLKDCPFYMFLDVINFYSPTSDEGWQSDETHDVLYASGSEDHNVYVWKNGYSLPIQVFKQSAHVGSVCFNTKIPGMLASASDDNIITIYVSSAHRMCN